MDYSGKISNLTSFLFASNPPPGTTTRFLVLNTFSEFKPTSLVLGLLESDGSMSVVGNFSVNQIAKDRTLHYFSSADNPLLQAIKNDEIIEIDESNPSSIISPSSKKSNPPDESPNYSIIWPVYFIGAGILHIEKKVELTTLDKLFFRTIGGMLALNYTCTTLLSDKSASTPTRFQRPRNIHERLNLADSSESGEPGKYLAGTESRVDVGELTPRQSVILAELARGKTNSSIAEDLNYSESLIRQETIEIYRKMGISGRRELLKDAISQ